MEQPGQMRGSCAGRKESPTMSSPGLGLAPEHCACDKTGPYSLRCRQKNDGLGPISVLLDVFLTVLSQPVSLSLSVCPSALFRLQCLPLLFPLELIQCLSLTEPSNSRLLLLGG
ncbi:hypothetical protein RRG08_043100 [Elysia crispata]|uniref:Uncharacterized protein n=1 Tax=Elysia crispata TaxID=231223 RepID=A0AAE0XYD6_9GAST|nr:hypothetical protein RRG08_043100 [Elysia crispata]